MISPLKGKSDSPSPCLLITFLLALHNIPVRCAYPQLTAKAPRTQSAASFCQAVAAMGLGLLYPPLFHTDTSLLFHNRVESGPTQNVRGLHLFSRVSVDFNPQTTALKPWVQSHPLQPSSLHQSKTAAAPTPCEHLSWRTFL